MTDKITENISGTVFALLTAMAIGLSSFSLKFAFDANAEMKAMAVQMEHLSQKIDLVSQNSEEDQKQNQQLRKHWKIHSATKEAINEDRAGAGKDLFKWPDLD